MEKNSKEKICIECGNTIPPHRSKRAITCSKKCSNKRATTTSNKRRRVEDD